MTERKSISLFIRARKKSFGFAFEGVLAFFKQQPNAFIHLMLTAAVIVLSVLLDISFSEMALMALATGFVWAAEIFNTAIEAIMDHLSPERHPAVKKIKDMAAAAVLVSAFAAAVTGLFIFIPKIF